MNTTHALLKNVKPFHTNVNKKKNRPRWEIVRLRGFSSHTSEELATHGALGRFFFFFFSWVNKLRPELWLHQSPSHEHWRGMRGTRQQSHQLWQIPIYEQMLTQRWIEGGKKWRQTGAEAFCFPPRCCDLTWARRHWYICSPAKLASLRLSDSTGIHVVWQRMHKQQEIWG